MKYVPKPQVSTVEASTLKKESLEAVSQENPEDAYFSGDTQTQSEAKCEQRVRKPSFSAHAKALSRYPPSNHDPYPRTFK